MLVKLVIITLLPTASALNIFSDCISLLLSYSLYLFLFISCLLYTPKFYILSVFLNYIFAGVFGALFFSIFLRKSPSIFSNNSVEETNDEDKIDNNKEE